MVFAPFSRTLIKIWRKSACYGMSGSRKYNCAGGTWKMRWRIDSKNQSFPHHHMTCCELDPSSCSSVQVLSHWVELIQQNMKEGQGAAVTILVLPTYHIKMAQDLTQSCYAYHFHPPCVLLLPPPLHLITVRLPSIPLKSWDPHLCSSPPLHQEAQPPPNTRLKAAD